MPLELDMSYRLFPYERRFLEREVAAFGGKIQGWRDSSAVVSGLSSTDAQRLTYVAAFRNGAPPGITVQAARESREGRQNTRYGPHGIHEYKGKFNPQTPRSLLLQLRKRINGPVLDPFAGSGTTLVEARHLALPSIGVELNPLAHLITSAKLQWETPPPAGSISAETVEKLEPFLLEESVVDYLSRWFPDETLTEVGKIIVALESLPSRERPVAAVLLSNLLRSYSYQDPSDLRIRRRAEIPPQEPLIRKWAALVEEHAQKRRAWVKQHGIPEAPARVILGDSTHLEALLKRERVGATVSSPPYATALPYVDTYRLSLVALGLEPPSRVLSLEREILGARDISSEDRRQYERRKAGLPAGARGLLSELDRLLEQDGAAGFRKRAVPFALARYLEGMRSVLHNLRKVETSGAPNAWVVGPNATELAGRRVVIDTPELLAELARDTGFVGVQVEPLEAYGRYDLHSRNSIRSEALVMFSA